MATFPSYLFVHYDINHWVVDCRALGKEGRDGHKDRAKVRSLVSKDIESHRGIRDPANKEGNHHKDDHASDFFLSLLGGS